MCNLIDPIPSLSGCHIPMGGGNQIDICGAGTLCNFWCLCFEHMAARYSKV